MELPGQAGYDHRHRAHCAAPTTATRPRPASPAYDHVFGNLAEFSAGEVERGVQHGRGPADRLRDEVLALRCRESQTRKTGAQTANADDGDDRSEPVTGLAANTEYELKMRACNRPAQQQLLPLVRRPPVYDDGRYHTAASSATSRRVGCA